MTSTCQLESDTKTRMESSAPVKKSAPLTHAQESLFFLDQLTNGLPVYHMPQAFRVRGKFNRKAFERAVMEVVSRHPALRARIIETADGPRQFSSGSPADFEIVD